MQLATRKSIHSSSISSMCSEEYTKNEANKLYKARTTTTTTRSEKNKKKLEIMLVKQIFVKLDENHNVDK